RALRLCEDNGVLVVAAVGNDGCDCLQAPAARPSALAVGATGPGGEPLDSNNWGAAYRMNGVLAPGQNIEGAAPGGGRIALTGSSFATPAVAGVAALLVAAQLAQGHKADPLAAGRAILESATVPPCAPDDAPQCRRHLGGHLNASGAFELIRRGSPAVSSGAGVNAAGEPPLLRMTGPETNEGAILMETNAVQANAAEAAEGVLPAVAQDPATTAAPDPAPDPVAEPTPPPVPPFPPAAQPAAQQTQPPVAVTQAVQAVSQAPAASEVGVQASCGGGGSPASGCQCGGQPSASGNGNGNGNGNAYGLANGASRQLIYAIGTIGFDYRTEARRDSFRQLMPAAFYEASGTAPEREVQANIYDPAQLHAYLAKEPWVSDKVTWTLNMDATPIYALEAETPVGMDWHRPIIQD
ncbi:S8 family serine peptidase, partial [Streptomyces sp. IB201691-2A2]|uniref:S8 family serine peptidase n=1 Tax=Streptomyces sp. IB201691-2A2 TaxID=2561920 RepID=UPI00163DA2C6